MIFKPIAAAAALACLAFVASEATAQVTLYKLIDKTGKVTYVETPPKDYDGKVIRLDIDPNANTATLPTGPREGVTPREERRSGPQERGARDAASRLQLAQDRLDAARKALADAQDNPGEQDVQWVGNKSGGVRRVPTETYTRRLEALQQAVKEAEADVLRAEQGR
jgi:hypothetical protein